MWATFLLWQLRFFPCCRIPSFLPLVVYVSDNYLATVAVISTIKTAEIWHYLCSHNTTHPIPSHSILFRWCVCVSSLIYVQMYVHVCAKSCAKKRNKPGISPVNQCKSCGKSFQLLLVVVIPKCFLCELPAFYLLSYLTGSLKFVRTHVHVSIWHVRLRLNLWLICMLPHSHAHIFGLKTNQSCSPLTALPTNKQRRLLVVFLLQKTEQLWASAGPSFWRQIDFFVVNISIVIAVLLTLTFCGFWLLYFVFLEISFPFYDFCLFCLILKIQMV